MRAHSILLTSVRRSFTERAAKGGITPNEEARSTDAATSTADARAISKKRRRSVALLRAFRRVDGGSNPSVHPAKRKKPIQA